MVAHLRSNARSGVGGEDDVGGLVGEVAVDALAQQRAAAAGEEAAAFYFVARETARGEVDDVALWRVDVMACRAGHV